MSVPQDSRARRTQKKRRTKKLAQWREKQQTQASSAQTAPEKKKA
jgi:hypothetical protein